MSAVRDGNDAYQFRILTRSKIWTDRLVNAMIDIELSGIKIAAIRGVS